MKALLAASLAASLALAPAAGAGAADATVRFVGFSPLKVRGDGFVPGERVRATVRANRLLRVRTVRVSSGGSFVVAFGSARIARCSGGLTVTVVGASGDRAVRALPPMECPVGIAASSALPGH